MIFTVDANGNPGHPTRRFDQIRKLLKRGQVRLIGGGLSGKPVTAVFLQRFFDVEKTITREFVRVLDPGYNDIGYAVCEVKGDMLIVLCRGALKTRIADIKGLMRDRHMHRRARRTIARFKMRRLSRQQHQVLTKFKKPRYIRSQDKTSATLQHGVDVHMALYGQIYKLCPLPIYQTVQGLEDNVFDVRTMTWGATTGKGYQHSPRTEIQQKVCLLCGTNKGLHEHHLITRKKGGTDIAENKRYLCKGCHEDVHAGRVYLPIKGIRQNRALGTMNAIAGVLRQYTGILRIPASDMAAKRRGLGVEKEHGNDAVCAAAALFGCTSVYFSQEKYVQLTKFRRHNRARIHAVRERNYVIDGKIVAQNRNKRMDQKTDSLSDLQPLSLDIRRKLVVRPRVKLYNPGRKTVPTIGGDVWVHNEAGKRFIATGVQNSGQYLYSPGLKGIIGKAYIRPEHCRRLSRNAGMVVGSQC